MLNSSLSDVNFHIVILSGFVVPGLFIRTSRFHVLELRSVLISSYLAEVERYLRYVQVAWLNENRHGVADHSALYDLFVPHSWTRRKTSPFLVLFE